MFVFSYVFCFVLFLCAFVTQEMRAQTGADLHQVTSFIHFSLSLKTEPMANQVFFYVFPLVFFLCLVLFLCAFVTQEMRAQTGADLHQIISFIHVP